MNSRIIGGDDPMVQQAMQVDQRQLQLQAMIKGLEAQIMTSVFAQLAIQHFNSGEKLTLETGRILASETTTIVSGYTGFLLEQLGLASVSKAGE